MPISKLPVVVIVGRTNVGKSTLFNRLTESHQAIVSSLAGTTRDYNIGPTSWRGKTFDLIDTGGVNIEVLKNSINLLLSKKMPPADTIEQAIIRQTSWALKKANLVLMLVDGQSGLLAEDKQLALVIKKLKLPTLLVCNKIDTPKWRHQASEFFKLGLGQPLMVSANNGSGSGDLLDEVVKKIKGKSGRPKKTEPQPGIKVAIIGKPNVGKSSLLNAILGEERVIVSDLPHTTRDPQNSEIEYQDQKIILIDTAGLRKKPNIEPGIEKLSTQKTLNMIKKSDLVILVTEVNTHVTVQDLKLAALIKDSGSGVILVANKWDLVGDKTTKTADALINYYHQAIPYLTWAPIIFVSALTGQTTKKILDLILQVSQNRKKIIEPKDLAEFRTNITHKKRPVQAAGEKSPKIIALHQTWDNPPTFTATLSRNDSLHFSYLRFIENQLRQHFGFIGVPIRIKVKASKK